MSHLWHLTCNSHTGNLLAKDLVNSNLTGQVKQEQKAFHRPDMEKEILLNGGHLIQMPGDTR